MSLKDIKYTLNLKAEIVLVTGDRDWRSIRTISDWLLKFKNLKLIINGGASGADELSTVWSMSQDIPHLVVPAKWSKHHKAAGPIRNTAMLEWLEILNQSEYQTIETEFINQVLAFHTDIKHSKGTKDMITQAHKAGYPVYLVDKVDYIVDKVD